jgi:hypothetical protein
MNPRDRARRGVRLPAGGAFAVARVEMIAGERGYGDNGGVNAATEVDSAHHVGAMARRKHQPRLVLSEVEVSRQEAAADPTRSGGPARRLAAVRPAMNDPKSASNLGLQSRLRHTPHRT